MGRLFPIVEDDAWGFIDVEGNVVIEPQFKEVNHFSDGLAAVKSVWDERWGYVDPSGSIVIEPVFDAASPFFEGRAAVTVDGGQGFIDKRGEFVINPFYKQVRRFSQGRAFVLVGRGWKIVDTHGRYVTQNSFAQINLFREGLASFVGLNNDYSASGYIDRNGDTAILLGDEYFVNIDLGIGFSYGRASVFKLESNPLAQIFRPNAGRQRLYGLIDTSGQLVVDPQYAFLDIDSKCMVLVSIGGKYGAIDLNGNTLIPLRYRFIGRFSEGLAIAQRRLSEKYGYIDEKGGFVIEPLQEIDYPIQELTRPLELPDNRSFNHGRALFRSVDSQYGYIDRLGNIVIKPKFDSAFPFKNGLAKFENSDEWGYINTTGAVVWRSEKAMDVNR